MRPAVSVMPADLHSAADVDQRTLGGADQLFRLDDRGVVAEGYLADLNIIDFERLSLPVPHIIADLPAGGERLVQRAEGYVATIKSGRPTFREGEHAGVYPGKVVRGAQRAHSG